MHQINRISQNLLSRSLVVRQPIVCKGCIRYNRSATSRNSSSLAQRFLPPLRKAQSSPSETPLSRLHRLHRFFRADLPWSHNIVQGLVLCATIALHCTDIALHCTLYRHCARTWLRSLHSASDDFMWQRIPIHQETSI